MKYGSLRHRLWVWYLEASYKFGFRVRCFGTKNRACQKRVLWDPIVGAYCTDCLEALIHGRVRVARTQE